MPKFSITTITFNAEEVLERTIKSIVGQSYKGFEYIIVDGVSKDKTLSIADKYKGYIDIIILEKDKGMRIGYFFIQKGWIKTI